MAGRKTSAAAYNEIRRSGLLRRLNWKIYDCLWYCGPMTARQVSTEINQNRNDTASALTKLRNSGCVEETGEEKCATTGRTVILWDVTDKLPVRIKPPKRKTRKQLEAERDWLFDECLRLKALLEKSGIK